MARGERRRVNKMKGAPARELRRLRSQQVWHRGFMRCFVDETHIRAFWFEIRDTDLYQYERKGDAEAMCVVPLGGGGHFAIRDPSIQPHLSLIDRSTVLTSVELMLPNGQTKEFVFFDEAAHEEWLTVFQDVLPPCSFENTIELISSQLRPLTS